MKKTALLLLSLIFVTNTASFGALGKDTKGPFGYNLYDDINRKPAAQTQNKASDKTSKEFYGDDEPPEWESEQIYYPRANINSAINKYKHGNYSGCLQEMISLTKTDPANPVVYYYMGMSYTQVGKKDQAVKAYEAVLKLNSDRILTEYARKGRDCLVGGPTCAPETAEGETDEALDDFINSPYGNGFSEELNQEVKQQQLKNIQKTINEKKDLEHEDIQKIKDFDHKGEAADQKKTAENTATNDDIIKAIETLKKAGVTVSVTPMQMNNQYAELGMLLGNNNNNNSMMNMVPFLMSQHQNGQKIDPQLLQSMMMNSMLPDFTFSDNDNKY